MTQLRDREKDHHEVITELSTTLMDQYSKGRLEEDLPEALTAVQSHSQPYYACACVQQHILYMYSVLNLGF